VHEQVEKLYTAIEGSCEIAREGKRSIRMLLDATELQLYLQSAFDHYARTLNTAFDFVQASFIHNPIPLDFGGNILRLAINLMEDTTSNNETARPIPRMIFRTLSSMIASCIMVDSVRHGIIGNIS
jgi:hypothetical protein